MTHRPIWLAAALFLLLAACAPKVVPPAKQAAYYFKQGEKYFAKGDYKQAITAWQKVRDSYYSPEMTALAQRKIADAQYRSARYVEAAASYQDFLREHPQSRETAEVLYQLGMSYYQQILTPDRDQTATRNALATFDNLLRRFPDSPRAGQARLRAQHCRDTLAEHQFVIGKFYLVYGHPRAAVSRLRETLARYPQFPQRDKVYFFLAKAYLKSGQRKQTAATCNTLLKDFPASRYRVAARKLLAKSR